MTPTTGSRSGPPDELPVAGRLAKTVEIEGGGIQFGVVTDAAVWFGGPRGEVHRFDPRSLDAFAPVRVGKDVDKPPPDAQALTVGAEGVWVTLGASRAVALLDQKTGKEIRRFPVDGNPYAAVESGDDLWVTDFGSHAVYRIDRRTGRSKAKVFVPAPTGIAAGEGGIWATSHRDYGSVFRIDPRSAEVVAEVPTGPRPYTVAIGFGSVWTSDVTGGTVTRIDPKTDDVIATIDVGNEGVIDVEIAAGSVWAAVIPQSVECDGSNGWIDRIDPTTNRVVARVPAVCDASLAVHDDRLWVTSATPNGPGLSLLEPLGR
jgi:DNA-binding beta-propeller fold protein YncE